MTINDRMRKFAHQIGQQVSAASDAVNGGVETAANAVSDAATRATKRALYKVDDALWTVRRPVAVSLRTAGGATRAILEDVGWTFILGSLFPPAVPLYIGISLLLAPYQSKEILRKAASEVDEERAKQVADRHRTADSTAAWSGQVSTETDYLRLVIDTETGKADGVILSGQYAGMALSAIPLEALEALREAAPDDATGQVLGAWIKRVTPNDFRSYGAMTP